MNAHLTQSWQLHTSMPQSLSRIIGSGTQGYCVVKAETNARDLFNPEAVGIGPGVR